MPTIELLAERDLLKKHVAELVSILESIKDMAERGSVEHIPDVCYVAITQYSARKLSGGMEK